MNQNVVATQFSNLSPGLQNLRLSFDAIPPAIYSTADGDATVESIAESITIPDHALAPWTYFRKVFYTEYNIPYESQCSGADIKAYIVDNDCNVTPIQLNAAFVGAAWLNGHGVERNGQILFSAYGAGLGDTQKCAGKYPPGAIGHTEFDGNTFVRATSIPGSCANQNLVPNKSVAVPVIKGSDHKYHPSTLSGVIALKCGQSLNLDNGNYSIAYTLIAADICPVCSNPATFNDADGHIDSFSGNQSCTGKQVGNLGSFYTSLPTN